MHLTLRHNGKLVYEVPASTALARPRRRCSSAPRCADALYDVDGRAGRGRADAASSPTRPATAATPSTQYLFVNGRWVRDRSLGHAVQEAYRGLLMTGRYAVAFLFLDLPPDQVDVNVHPTKAEVRFRDAQMLYHLVFGAVKHRLLKANLVPRLQVPSTTCRIRAVDPEVVERRRRRPAGRSTPTGGPAPRR